MQTFSITDLPQFSGNQTYSRRSTRLFKYQISMDMKIRHISLLLIMLVSFPSCEREVKDVKLPRFVQKLVVVSFLSPDDSVSLIRVTSNSPVLGEINQFYDTGILTGTISNGTRTTDLTACPEGLCFSHEDMKVEEGLTYSVKIQSSTGLKAEASCRVPVRNDRGLEADTVITFYEGDGYNPRYIITSKIYMRNPPGEDNYFRFFCKALIYDEGFYYYPEKHRLIGSENEIFTDNRNEGSRILANTVISDLYPKSDSAFLVFYILNTDESYYLYHRSLEDYSGGGDDPFTEISPVYSNVSGGLGVFAAYSADSLVFRVK